MQVSKLTAGARTGDAAISIEEGLEVCGWIWGHTKSSQNQLHALHFDTEAAQKSSKTNAAPFDTATTGQRDLYATFQLLADDEPERCEHGHTAVHQLTLPPSADFLHTCTWEYTGRGCTHASAVGVGHPGIYSSRRFVYLAFCTVTYPTLERDAATVQCEIPTTQHCASEIIPTYNPTQVPHQNNTNCCSIPNCETQQPSIFNKK
jgi:hypothetical protein